MWLTSVEAKDVEWAAELSACLWCLAVGYFLPCHSGLNLALYSNEDWRQITFSCSRRIKNSSGHEVILLGKIDAHTHLANTKKKKGKRVWMRFGAQRLVKYCRHFFFFLAEMLTQKEETQWVEFLKKNLYTLRITADIFTFGLSYLADR